MKFRDRRSAGKLLGELLAGRTWSRPLVLALPRGGVPVALEVARALGAPLNIFVARKVGAPGHREFGIGAVAEGGVSIFDERSVSRLGLSRAQLEELVEAEERELRRRVEIYRTGRPLPDLKNREVILIDDGLATGVTAQAALQSLDRVGAARLVLAVPVCAPQTRDRLAPFADEVVCLVCSEPFIAVGLFYEDFSQTTDAEVMELVGQAPAGATAP
jgi:putative phosphoribosyl transferase